MIHQNEFSGLETTPQMLVAAAKQSKRRQKGEEMSKADYFCFQCKQYGLPQFMAKPNECYFAKSIGRQWRFDVAFVNEKVAVEIEGLVVRRLFDENRKPVNSLYGRHATITGFKEDAEKYAEAAILGWTVLRFEQSQVKDNTAIAMTMRMLETRGWVRPT